MDGSQACFWMLTGLAAAAPALAAPAAELEWPSCVAGSPPLRAPLAAEQALLDAADRQHFQQAAQARYPLYQRGGLLPDQVLMLRRGGQWQYLALSRWSATGLCVTAVFAADAFDFSPAWRAKYRPRAVEAGD